MVELQRLSAAVTGCYARPETLDRLAAAKPLAIRVAPDELLMFADPGDGTDRVASVEQALSSPAAEAVVIDVSGGFALWRVRGDWTKVFARLCAAPLPDPPTCTQALFAHVPAKLVVAADELLVVVSSAVSHHVRDRILAACRDLDPHEVEAVPLSMRIAEAAA